MAPTAGPSRAFILIGAMAAPMLVWLVAVPVLGVQLSVDTGGGHYDVGPVGVLIASLVVALLGVGLVEVLRRRTPNARRVFVIVSLVVLAVSLTGPLGSGTDAAARSALAVMHLAVAAVVIPALARRAGSPSQ
jgi:low temperature requirement protein LtrA